MENVAGEEVDVITRMQLFEVWRGKDAMVAKKSRVYDYVVDYLELGEISGDITGGIKRITDDFCDKVKAKWHRSNRTLKNFFTKNENWLKGHISIPHNVQAAISTKRRSLATRVSYVGRPRKMFQEASLKTKKRRVEPLLSTASHEELTFAAQVSLRSKGRRDAANILKQVSEYSPKRATRFKKAYKVPSKQYPVKLSHEQALFLFVDARLTKAQYLKIRAMAKTQQADIYPPYNAIVEAKRACYPDEQQITITETTAEVSLQALLDHTIQRIICIQREVLSQVEVGIKTPPHATIIFKWGCDGASGQSLYKQRFADKVEEGQIQDDSFLFVVCLVPLQMTTTSNESSSTQENQLILWKNPRPSSTRYCRPIKLLFRKESAKLTREEVQKVESQIDQLLPTDVTIDGRDIKVHHKLVLTMLDGKVCSALSETSSQTCYICGAKPKEMNNLESHSRKVVDTSKFTFGLSSLHAWIRLFECLLHISYRLEIKTWQVKKADRQKVHARKRQIQERFRKEMGLLVDIVKQGSGTTNDGNTARRFFANPSLSSDITGISEELIHRFGTILTTIACGFDIDSEAFKKFTMDTAQLYIKHYNWYYMPASVHKILIHGGDVIQSAILPMGQLSEEAQEARNKDCKRFRDAHTRKFSRTQTMTDLFHMLLITSDPVISSQKNSRHWKTKRLPQEVVQLLATPISTGTADEESDEENYSDDTSLSGVDPISQDSDSDSE